MPFKMFNNCTEQASDACYIYNSIYRESFQLVWLKIMLIAYQL